MTDELLAARLVKLERAIHRQRIAMAVVGAVALGALLSQTIEAQPAPTAGIRTRSLVIEDAEGRARILMGAPLPGIGGEARSGIRINDPDGFERLGMNLFEDGRIVLGLDAPRGAGDDRNRERISLIADGKGGSSIVFKDRRTSVVGRIYLDSANQLWLEFADYMSTPNLYRRMGVRGEDPPR
jgi:hypothetical protein